MHSWRAIFCLLSLMLSVGCDRAQESQIDSAEASQIAAPLPVSKAAEPTIGAVVLPVKEVPLPGKMLPEPSRAYFPIYGGSGVGGGGGSGGRRKLPCENGTRNCNDKNPCTIDTCENDICVHVLDITKDQFGDCEQDGSSCTLGKCIEFGEVVQCFEQRREFIAGELGCQDSNQCTADSCIEFPLSIEEKQDKDGNVIPDNEYQCVQELTTGLLCNLDQGCLRGFCQESGSGMGPNNPFIVSCIADQTAPVDCPATANPCTINICDEAEGCIEENLQAGTPCDDGSVCTADDICNDIGLCTGTAIDPEVACGASPETCRTFACDATLGCVLTEPANEGLACSNGDPCTMSETCTTGVCGNGIAVTCPSDNNICTSDTCKAGTGCIYPAITVDPPTCSDNNACTTGDACTDGACVGVLENCSADLDATCQVGFCDITVGCQTIDFTGPFGADCTTPYPGVCASGAIMCVDGVLTDPPMCEPLVRPGDKLELCNSETDANCDGEPDNSCNCPVPPDISIRRYVDPTGSNAGANNCTDANNPCQTIAYAISVATAGDTLILAEETFPETNIIVDKNLFIFGQGPDFTIVQANGTNRVFTVNSSITASFCGLTITGAGITGFSNGGGIFNLGTATINSCNIRDNRASQGAGIFNNTGSIVSITDSTISGNISNFNGGGIFNQGTTTINKSIISGNSLSFTSSGGGIFNTNGTVNITESTFSGNLASQGGGIFNNIACTVNITDSTFTGNASFSGAAIQNASSTSIANITRSTFSSNAASSSGGAFNISGGTVNITNSTLSGNSAGTFGGGAIIATGLSSTVNITNSTITKNSALANGGGIRNLGAVIRLSNTIVADQTLGADCFGTALTDNGFNLDKDNTCPAGFNTVPAFTLPSLANNGGPTKTHALVAFGMGTEAIDAGDTTCGVTTDQRGELKPVDYPGILPDGTPHCDIGSFEIQAP